MRLYSIVNPPRRQAEALRVKTTFAESTHDSPLRGDCWCGAVRNDPAFSPFGASPYRFAKASRSSSARRG